MKNKIPKRYITKYIIAAALLTVITFSLFSTDIITKSETIETIAHTIPAEIETEVLQQWRQSNGLKQTLTHHAVGPDVVLLQRMLAQNENIYPEKKVTGYYGDMTAAAVGRFQDAYNLPRTENVDETTKNKLNEVFLAHLCPEQNIIYPDFSLKRMTRQTPPLPEEYIPPVLEDISNKVKTIGIICLHTDVVPNTMQMINDAKKDDVHLAISSGYRSYETQRYLYNYWHKKHGTAAADFIAEPGKSEHQLGTTIDVTDASIEYAAVDTRFGKSDGGKWMKENAHRYGFTMSYPKGKKNRTGYQYEPWHWRFIGVKDATILHVQKKAVNEPLAITQKKVRPIPIHNIQKGLTLSANAAVAIFTDTNETERILMQKNRKRRIPIASITKLMTALVAFDLFKLDDHIIINQSALNGKGVSGKFTTGETISLEDALHAILIESNNEIAIAIAETIGIEMFIQKMNDQAHKLKMHDTQFVNVTGLDPRMGSEKMNYATASDIAGLLQYIFENKKDIFAILKKRKHTITEINTGKITLIETTNELFTDQEKPLQVLGGKTGTTPKAKHNLAIISRAPLQKGYIITVVIGSENSFIDTQDLLRYIKNAFIW